MTEITSHIRATLERLLANTFTGFRSAEPGGSYILHIDRATYSDANQLIADLGDKGQEETAALKIKAAHVRAQRAKDQAFDRLDGLKWRAENEGRSALTHEQLRRLDQHQRERHALQYAQDFLVLLKGTNVDGPGLEETIGKIRNALG